MTTLAFCWLAAYVAAMTATCVAIVLAMRAAHNPKRQ